MRPVNDRGVSRFEKNVSGNDYVVGDIHGCFSKLSNDLKSIGFDEKADRLFCVGDLIDRGPESDRFIEWLEKPWFHSVRGNHEQLLIGHYQGEQSMAICHIQNGGEWYAEWNLLGEEQRSKMYKYCLALPYLIEVETDRGTVGVMHADPGHYEEWGKFKEAIQSRDEKAREACIWSRHFCQTKSKVLISGINQIYAGHTPDSIVRNYGNLAVIDTGACFKNGHFTILRIN